MKILIIGMLGAGKSTLAYDISHRFGLARLNLDECRRGRDGARYPLAEQQQMVTSFMQQHREWVSEGCDLELYGMLDPDLIVYVDTGRLRSAWRFTLRFFKAGRLQGKTVAADLPVQAYHYRRPTPVTIWDWDQANRTIRRQIEHWLAGRPCVRVRTARQRAALLAMIAEKRGQQAW